MAANSAGKDGGVRKKHLVQVQSEVAKDMIAYVETRRPFEAADIACLRRWRSNASWSMLSWGALTSAIAYGGAKLAAGKAPLSLASRSVVGLGFIVGAGSALPSTAMQLLYESARLDTEFGAYTRASWAKHADGPLPWTGGQPIASSSPQEANGVVGGGIQQNQWGDQVLDDAKWSSSSDAAPSEEGDHSTFHAHPAPGATEG